MVDYIGNITIEKKRDGTLVNNTYDDLNRLVSRSIQRATGVEDTTAESYGYDGLSRLTRAQDNDALVLLKYTSLGRIKEETQNGKNVFYTYTKDGLRNSIKYPNGRIIAREFDDLNRLSAIKEDIKSIADFKFIGSALSANGGTFAIANLYNLGRSGSRLLNKKYGNGDISTYGYDQAKRLNHSETKNKNSEIINDYIYGYNKLDLKSFEKRNHENGQGDVYAYDELKRLIGVKYDSPEPENHNTTQFARSREYALDRVDNITKMVDKQNNETNETLIEKSGNCFKLNQYSKFGNVVLEYDQNGNMIRKGNQYFHYNYRNQLVRITEGQMEIGYKYDALGRRIERTKGTDTERYYYCDNQVIEERNGTDQVIKQYVYGNGIDEAIQLKIVNGANAGDYYYHANGIGSTTAITDVNGALIERIKYDVYGTPTFTDAAGQPLANNQSAISNTVLFQGRDYDQDAGLYYFRARYYDPSMGRFMQTDPIGYWDSYNLYQAFYQNSVNYLDPYGDKITFIGEDPYADFRLFLSVFQNIGYDDIENYLVLNKDSEGKFIADLIGGKNRILEKLKKNKNVCQKGLSKWIKCCGKHINETSGIYAKSIESLIEWMLITNKSTIEFKTGSEIVINGHTKPVNAYSFGGGVTGEPFETQSGNIEIVVNPNSYSDFVGWFGTLPLDIPTIIIHELGHALGSMMGFTNKEAMFAELAILFENFYRLETGQKQLRKSHAFTTPLDVLCNGD